MLVTLAPRASAWRVPLYEGNPQCLQYQERKPFDLFPATRATASLQSASLGTLSVFPSIVLTATLSMSSCCRSVPSAVSLRQLYACRGALDPPFLECSAPPLQSELL